MASSELQKRKLEEYEMQLFSFHSRAVYATLQNIINERICSTIEKMCETIGKAYELNSENLSLLKTNGKQLERAYFKGAMPQLENIKNVVNKYIAVPSNVLLEEDKHQRIQYSDAEFESLNQRLEDLQERAKKATILNAILKEELQILEQFSISEGDVNKMCDIIENMKCPDIGEKMYQLVEDYKQFSTSLFDTRKITTKMKYNTVDNLKCKEFDLSIL
ncbi:protein MIS12 homolog [Frieseomelitta varia]|uniref:protein MIS12 homolog n=1 Tax=Frieseomelitta varia TaxID=561572 RepID=UPI001CB69A59|nr:protein MIS12 homolog [Frieseomelitta varia]XP_043506427.1 protein MIS12 homolog [Frieseomelitta varia]XP_043506429.1 protein MIS12 homolog [Frieseomelitta varia]